MVKITTLGTSHGSPTVERFNTSTLVEIPEEGGFLVDAGTPVLALLIRKGFPLENLKAVFITHMHEDHFGGLPDILKEWVKKMPRKKRLMLCLPEPDVVETIFAFTELAHRKLYREMFEIRGIMPGIPVCFPSVEINAVPTAHFSSGSPLYPSYALTVETRGRKILLTGDLASDFHDFPKGTKSDLALCELAHYSLEKALPALIREKFGKLIFTHIGNAWHGKAAEANFREMVSVLPYPAVIAHDGDVFEI